MISLFMKKRKINKQTQIKIKKYMEYMYEEEINQNSMDITNEMITSLPNKLKNNLKVDLYGNLLKSIPVLHDNFSNEFLEELSVTVTEMKFIPGEIIYSVIKNY